MEDELSEYLEKVDEELKRREKSLAGIEQRIAELEFEIRKLNPRRAVLSGDAAQAVSVDSFRRLLTERLRDKKREREEAVRELERAQDRRKTVEEDLKRGASE